MAYTKLPSQNLDEHLLEGQTKPAPALPLLTKAHRATHSPTSQWLLNLFMVLIICTLSYSLFFRSPSCGCLKQPSPLPVCKFYFLFRFLVLENANTLQFHKNRAYSLETNAMLTKPCLHQRKSLKRHFSHGTVIWFQVDIALPITRYELRTDTPKRVEEQSQYRNRRNMDSGIHIYSQHQIMMYMRFIW